MKSSRIKCGHVARMGAIKNAYKILEDTITDLKEMGWEIVDWIHLAQGMDQWHTLVNMVMNLRVL
jgi:hypothetical protein